MSGSTDRARSPSARVALVDDPSRTEHRRVADDLVRALLADAGPTASAAWSSRSYTDGAVAAAVGWSRVGVDVERVLAALAVDDLLVDRTCTPRERDTVLGAAAPAAELTRLWVRKEAVLKAAGHGLAVAPRALDVLDDRPADGWALRDLAVGPSHRAAVAWSTR